MAGKNYERVEVKGLFTDSANRILTPSALDFVANLHYEFNSRRRELLQKRAERKEEIRSGVLPDFLTETADIRAGDWKIAPIPKELEDRRVEITGPVDRKMVINALNSGANVYMADFEDSHSPTWEGTVDGQANLRDAVRRTISLETSAKKYELCENPAVLFVRPRGWHLEERHVLVGGEPVSASLFDFGIFFFHNAREQLDRGSSPCFYLPKMESRLEARLWNDVFRYSQDSLGIPTGTVKATCLIETVLAAFEMDEILYELREHSAGLNCGRWDYIFSFIKKFSHSPDYVLPDRSSVTMESHFLKSYANLLIQTCHRRGAHAMGGMAAQIPIKNDSAANERAMDKVRSDKLREAKQGHDGTWVAHPGLVALAKGIFDEYMPSPNQIYKNREDVNVCAKDLLAVPRGDITEEGLRLNVRVGIQYLSSWLHGIGCVPINNLMEDAATAEISRAQVWQWLRHESALSDGRKVNRSLYGKVLAGEVGALIKSGSWGREEDHAARLFDELVRAEEFPEFLTIPAYDELLYLKKRC